VKRGDEGVTRRGEERSKEKRGSKKLKKQKNREVKGSLGDDREEGLRGLDGKRRSAMTKRMSKEEKRVTELVRRRMKESRSTELLGFDVESVHAGRAIFRLDVRPNHKQIHGVVHGGILAALADTTAAIAAYTAVPRGTEIATVELSINYLEPVPGGRIKADARVLRAGRNFVVTECEIFNENGSLAAKALLTFGAAAGHSLHK